MTGEEGERRVPDASSNDVESERESLEHLLQGREMHLTRLRKEPNFPRLVILDDFLAV
jgi:hypothetical protein